MISIRRSSPNDIQIARFCSKINTVVRGGFSKLLKYVENIYNPDNVISFCDLRYGDGNVYFQTGFEYKSVTLGWQWTDYKNTYNRLQCRAHMDERSLSQEEHSKELGWAKIYDAGQAKYVKHLKGIIIEKEEYVSEVASKSIEIVWTNKEEQLMKQKIIELKELSIGPLAFELKQSFLDKNCKLIKQKILQIKKQHPEIFIFRFNYLTTLEALPSGNRIKCKCDCGNERNILKQLLQEQRVKSCGCMKISLCKTNGGRTKGFISTKQDKWKIEEEQILKQNYEQSNKEQLQILLPSRSWNGIKTRAQILGLKMNKNK